MLGVFEFFVQFFYFLDSVLSFVVKHGLFALLYMTPFTIHLSVYAVEYLLFLHIDPSNGPVPGWLTAHLLSLLLD